MSSLKNKSKSEVRNLLHQATKKGFCESRRSRLFCAINRMSEEISLSECIKLISTFLHRSETKIIREIEEQWNKQ